MPSDALGHEVAKLLIEPSATRDRLTAGMYASADAADNPVAQIERALAATLAAEPIEAKLRAAVKEGRFDREGCRRAAGSMRSSRAREAAGVDHRRRSGDASSPRASSPRR